MMEEFKVCLGGWQISGTICAVKKLRMLFKDEILNNKILIGVNSLMSLNVVRTIFCKILFA